LPLTPASSSNLREPLKDTSRQLDRAFNPRTVAVVGDKMTLGYMWLRSLANFHGKVYSVQIDEREFSGIASLGVENYPSLLDIPDDIDYVLIAVPNTTTPQVLSDCIQKNVGGVTLFTAGFAESGTEEGVAMQESIAEIARKGNLHLIGPNCMGIHNPRIGLCHNPSQPHGDGGNASFIAQSGTHATFLTLVAPVNGVRVSKSVSYGNAAVLDSTDYLEYFGDDDETEIIGIYIEGIKDGQRLLRTLRDVTRHKPVLIWKGGLAEDGKRATASHTSSLAGSLHVWDALIRQGGAIRVDGLDDMIDTMKVLLHAKPTTGNRVGLAAMTGGQSVFITDAFTSAGFNVPLLTEQSYRKFRAFFNTLGASYRNPLDVSFNFQKPDRIIKSLDILSQDDNIDAVVLEVTVPFLKDLESLIPNLFDDLIQELAQFKARCPKPFIAVAIPGYTEAAALDVKRRLVERDIPSFPSFQRGANALRKAIEYWQRQTD